MKSTKSMSPLPAASPQAQLESLMVPSGPVKHRWNHARSARSITPLSSKSPNVGHWHALPQRSSARATHVESQAPLQHEEFSAQTRSQHAGSSHPGVPSTTQQSPVPGQTGALKQRLPQRSLAILTQSKSQPRKQQKTLSAHTKSQQAASLHPEVACSSQQLPSPGQLPPQVSPQSVSARVTQSGPQFPWQQLASALQTASQQVKSLQPPPVCDEQQSPIDGHDPVQSGAHRLSANSTQIESHSPLQQKGSSAQMLSQQT